MLRDALLYDARGNPIQQHHKAFSEDWDEIRNWSSQVYMPYRVSPTGLVSRPNSTMHSAKVGRITVTRFAYGIPVNIRDWSAEAGNAVVLTTIQGHARHFVDARNAVETGIGGTFVVDCSRTDYLVDFDPDHLQLNLTIPHVILEQVCQDLFGFVPGDALWQHKCQIGGQGSSWLALMEYVMKSIAEAPGSLAHDRVGRHIEQSICIHLLNEWAGRAGFDVDRMRSGIAPRSVTAAERYMIEHAAALPTMVDVARAVGTSLRTLTGAFRRFRGYAPSAFLREQRLQGVRRDLLAARPDQTVSSLAYVWGYINLGEFAKAYYRRFGELPSETLRR
ncbi:helix-turn-helix transcriptional regulator [Methylobacterium sp.]|jgi:AraC-like DNA-binding protein|uniref:AraC family transcriptional regulator n=1 Tax=Methylobacterium sp. TaxID=409 RepID=UPI0025D0B5C1|nr:helix-turn-helix transcriptional regulator [Methylobacterium sp.]MBY0259746.1 AraC family transcriptional regulator [Methylobacterium sp.]